jgi:hypothetical protein
MKGIGFFFAVIVTALLTSCNTPEKLLCRSWRPTFIDFDEAKLNYDRSMKEEIVAQLKDTVLLTFNKDHTYRLRLPDRTESGNWRFSAKHDTIYTNYEHSGAASKVNSLTKEFLNLESLDKNGMEMKFIFKPVNFKPLK